VKNRMIAGVVALAVVAALGGLALAAGRNAGTRTPTRLPVLGASSGAAAKMSADASMAMRLRGPVRYEATGPLPALEGEADAYVLAAPKVDLDRFAALAHDLGIDGKVTRTDAGWSIVAGMDRVDVQDVAGLPWNRYRADPNCCAGRPGTTVVLSGDASTGSSGSSGSGTIVCGSPCPPDAKCVAPECPTEEPRAPQRPADLPTKTEAERIGRALLTKLGIDLDHATVRVDDGFSTWSVSADPEIDGLPVIGMTTSVGVGPKGRVADANGWLGEATKGDRYPLIGTTAALKKLGDDQVRILGGPQPMIARAQDGDCAADACTNMPVRPDCELATVDCPAPEPVVVHVTGVRLGLQLFSTYEPGAPAYLVPSYLFMTDDRNELPMIAVEDQYLGQAPKPVPVEPTPSAVEPNGPAATEPSTTETTTP
jgi:hypothetical protein